MTVTREMWAHSLLQWIGYPDKERNLIALIAWQAAEGGSGDNPPPQAKWNPLNTTLKLPGSWDYNEVPVQNYPDEETGLEATAKTLMSKGQGYAGIRRGLRDNAPPRDTLDAVERSNWGTGGLAKSIVDDVKHHWNDYATKAIGQ